MNQYPLWRYLLILGILGLGLIYALPNVFPDEPALQISPRRSEPVDQALEDKVKAALAGVGIALRGVERTDRKSVV
jgi:preprotein translocase subunit SecD